MKTRVDQIGKKSRANAAIRRIFAMRRDVTRRFNEERNEDLRVSLDHETVEVELREAHVQKKVQIQSADLYLVQQHRLGVVNLRAAAKVTAQKHQTQVHSGLEVLRFQSEKEELHLGLKMKVMEAQEKIREYQQEYQLAVIKGGTKILISKINAEIKVLEQHLKTESELEWLQYVKAHNEYVLKEILPKVQDEFVAEYSKTLDARNGKVKHIEEKLVLPAIACDGDPTQHLVYITQGRVK